MKQKFKLYDLVRIKKELPACMSHFTNNKDAIITKYSHNECQSESDWEHNYQIHIKGQGTTAWYHDSNLELIEHDCFDLLKIWEKELQDEHDLKSDLDWIFNNGIDVLEEWHGASISKLAECLGCDNLWGSHGEGFVYYENALSILNIAEPFLKTKDKIGFLNFIKIVQKQEENK